MKQPDPTEQRVVLPNVSWRQFQALQQEVEGDTRLTYWGNRLEMMTPLPDHQRCRNLLDSLIQLIADVRSQSIRAIAPVVLLDSHQLCAISPDAVYYRDPPPLPDDRIDVIPQIDIVQMPPPNLALEIVLNASSVDKFPIYASLGIEEVWRGQLQPHRNQPLQLKMTLHRLQDDGYSPIPASELFPAVTPAVIQNFIDQSETLSLVKALTLLRAWADAA
ncbi:MAG: Uma2 family endonuclease [Kaiparowitsia implicata GSE-PSE-MK54-09C]|jgi:Uma2 family endonuclease|nr:Uma2 family endonuclease [Kaiparowitsia implicata GSE-PSE-MK54-09C]